MKTTMCAYWRLCGAFREKKNKKIEKDKPAAKAPLNELRVTAEDGVA